MILSPTPFLDQFEFPARPGFSRAFARFLPSHSSASVFQAAATIRFPRSRSRPRPNGPMCRINIKGVPISSPIWSRRCKAMPSRKRMCSPPSSKRAPRRHRKNRRLAIDRSDKLKQFQDARGNCPGAWPATRGQRELSRLEIEPELPRPAVAA